MDTITQMYCCRDGCHVVLVSAIEMTVTERGEARFAVTILPSYQPTPIRNRVEGVDRFQGRRAEFLLQQWAECYALMLDAARRPEPNPSRCRMEQIQTTAIRYGILFDVVEARIAPLVYHHAI